MAGVGPAERATGGLAMDLVVEALMITKNSALPDVVIQDPCADRARIAISG
jgi:hypothetical protein